VSGQQSAEAIVAESVHEALSGEGPNSGDPGGAVTLLLPVANPTGGAEWGRVVTQPAWEVDLMARILAPEKVRRAWKRVKANQGAPGVDGIPVEEFPAFARRHWPEIRAAWEQDT
jgi:RNA-directed DNA polymerase